MTAAPRTARSAIAPVAIAVAALLLVPRASAAGEWAWPLRGRVITPYQNDNARPYAGGMHRGIDIAAPVGTRVVAARSGRVSYAGALGSAGLTVAVETADGRYVTTYLHLSEASVRRGDALAAGERLGAVGTTGIRSAPEPHLHFGVRLAGKRRLYVDPLTLLPPLPGLSRQAPAPVAAPVETESVPAPSALPLARSAQPVRERASSPRPAGALLPHPISQPGTEPKRSRLARGTSRLHRPARSGSPAHAAVPGLSRRKSWSPRPGAEPGFTSGATLGRLLSVGGAVLIAVSLAGGAARRGLRSAPRRVAGVYERIGAAIALRSSRPRRLERRPPLASLK